MPRRRVSTRISDPAVRHVAGRMIFAAAAEALGGIYGPIAMERALAFSPRARAERRSVRLGGGLPPVKRSLPTGACKKWLQGHVPIEQTLTLIAQVHPNVAIRMQQVRDDDIVKSLNVAKDEFRLVGRAVAALSSELLEDYLGCMAMGHSNPVFIERLSAGLLHFAMVKRGSEALVAVLGVDRQMPSHRGRVADRSLDEAFDLALHQVAKTRAEVAFSKAALTEIWSHRKAERQRACERSRQSS